MHSERHVVDRTVIGTHPLCLRAVDHAAANTAGSPEEVVPHIEKHFHIRLQVLECILEQVLAGSTDLELGHAVFHAHTAGMAGHLNHNRTALSPGHHRLAPEVVQNAVDKDFAAGYSSDHRADSDQKSSCHTAAAADLGCIVVVRDSRTGFGLAGPGPRMCYVS